MENQYHFSLFSGIGGKDLAAEKAGFITAGQCEIADYPTKILEKHWPNVPRWRDIRDVTKETVEKRGIKKIDVISGGFPCQPFSYSGKRRGEDDDRFLWPEMLRVIEELRPNWIIGENVPGIIDLALERCLDDLGNAGYSSQSFKVPACAADSKQERYRIFILAHSPSRDGAELSQSDQRAISDSLEKEGDRWPCEPGSNRVAYGVPNRLDRIRCLGNACVPGQVYPFFKLVYEIESRLQNGD
jgi:DNA (cytosine-5)-methyltransferase 1